VLAAAIRVDRTIEGNIGRLVTRYDPARSLFLYFGFQRRQEVARIPAVIDESALEFLEAAAPVGFGPAPAPLFGIDPDSDEILARMASLTGPIGAVIAQIHE
jgi:hypothetical protein